jgi:ribose/xylose/arabinose/galactoside ABC-type transport system permease subunit
VLLPLLAVAVAVLIATLAGLCNGAAIVGLRLVPFIVTLGTMGIFRGLAKGIAHERDIYPPQGTWISRIMDPTLSTWVRWLTGEAKTAPAGLDWFILPLGVWILLAAAVFAALLLRYTRLGRHIFAVGSNQETARLCGVPVGRTKVTVYALAGLFGGLAGLMQFSFIDGIGQPTTAVSYELYVIAAVVIGGGSLMGGEGSILGSVIGALIITILNMGGQQMHWPKWVQEMVIGGIIIAAAALDQLRHRRLK